VAVGLLSMRAFCGEGAAPNADTMRKLVLSGDWKALSQLDPSESISRFLCKIACGYVEDWAGAEKIKVSPSENQDQVATFCKELVAADAQNPHAHFVLATHLWDKRDTQGAISEYNRVIELDSKHAPAYYQIAGIHGRSRDFRKQIEWAEKAIQTDPKYASAYFSKGSAHSELREYDQAIPQYMKAATVLEEKGVKKGHLLGQVYYNWGWILVNRTPPDNDQGAKVLEKSVAADPNRLEAYNELGITYKRKGAYQDASDLAITRQQSTSTWVWPCIVAAMRQKRRRRFRRLSRSRLQALLDRPQVNGSRACIEPQKIKATGNVRSWRLISVFQDALSARRYLLHGWV
jgi:tetratricopeptide (TPR) repeat protein